MMPARFWLIAALLLWATVTVATFALRPPLPIDETRYLSVAWEMWSGGDLLVPRLNGEPYSHKPPLLFWLIHLGWALFGAVEWWARLVPPLAGLATMLAARRLARLLWPDRPTVAALTPLTLIGMGGFAVIATMTSFDALLALAIVIGLTGAAMVACASGGQVATANATAGRGWLLFGLGIGVGVLAKGPVALLHLLPVALLAPLWRTAAPSGGWRRYYRGLGLAVLGGTALVLAWAIPAGISGGPAYRAAIFWGQSAGRIVESFAHDRPLWWYLPLLPIVLFSWLAWPALWRVAALRPHRKDRQALGFLATAAGASLAALSLISGKGPHYLMPLMPSAALAVAYAVARLDELPSRPTPAWPIAGVFAAASILAMGVASISSFPAHLLPRLPAGIDFGPAAWTVAAILAAAAILFAAARNAAPRWHAIMIGSVAPIILVVALGVFHATLRPLYDLHPVAAYLAAVERQGRPIGHMGDYKGQFDFLGRMTGTVDVLTTDAMVSPWIMHNPTGVLITIEDRNESSYGDMPEFIQPYRNRFIAVWSTKVLTRRGAHAESHPLRQVEADTGSDAGLPRSAH